MKAKFSDYSTVIISDLPINVRNEYVQNVEPKFSSLGNFENCKIFFLKDLDSLIDKKRFCRKLHIKTDNYTSTFPAITTSQRSKKITKLWSDFDKVFNPKIEEQINRYSQGFIIGYNLKVKLNDVENLFNGLSEQLRKLDISQGIDNFSDITLIETIPQNHTEINLHSHGIEVGRFVKRWETLLNACSIYETEQIEFTKDNKTKKDHNRTEEEIKSFDDLFHDPNIINESLDVLRNAEPPLIDKKDNWIGKPSGAICVWTEELKARGIMKRADGKILSKYLPLKINGFTISESMFRKHQQRAESNYRLQFKNAISKIKTT